MRRSIFEGKWSSVSRRLSEDNTEITFIVTIRFIDKDRVEIEWDNGYKAEGILLEGMLNYFWTRFGAVGSGTLYQVDQNHLKGVWSYISKDGERHYGISDWERLS